jgi:two-component system, OmpR family, response regulator ResD
MAASKEPTAKSETARRVLVVDDEHTIAEVVSRYLDRAGYDTRRAFAGPEAVAAVAAWDPDLVVLDVMLPGFDGLEVMRRLQDSEPDMQDGSRPAVILLTARGEEPDRITGLRRGADDYVVKPFSPAELVARVDAVLRRGAGNTAEGTAPAVIEAEDLVVDPACRTVHIGGREVLLTTLEFDLLAYLASHPGRVFTRDQLMQTVWNSPFFTDTSTVTVHVRRLRGKIEPDPRRPRYIQTARGVGYRFCRASQTSVGEPAR